MAYSTMGVGGEEMYHIVRSPQYIDLGNPLKQVILGARFVKMAPTMAPKILIDEKSGAQQDDIQNSRRE